MRKREIKRNMPVNKNQKSDPVVVAICVVHIGIAPMKWAENFQCLQLPFTSKRYSIGNILPVDCAREYLVRAAINDCNPEYIFFLDSDVLLPPNAIPQLIQIARQKNIPVLSGLYWNKGFGTQSGKMEPEEEQIPKPVAYLKDSEDLSKGIINIHPIVEEIKPYLDKNVDFEVDVVGAGCLLIKTDVFIKLEKSNPNKPFFQWGIFRKDENTGKPLLQVGEDQYFCDRLTRELGIRPYLTTAVQCNHIFYPLFCERQGLDGKLMI